MVLSYNHVPFAIEIYKLMLPFQKTESVIALATVLNQNTTLKALNVNRPLLFSHQEETTVHYARMLKVRLVTRIHSCGG